MAVVDLKFVDLTVLTAGFAIKFCMNKLLSELSTYQRGLASGVLVPKLSCTTVCCWATANQHSGWAHNQRGSLVRGE